MDIAAVLAVIKRRSKQSRDRECANNRPLDFRGAVLRRADLREVHLEGAILATTHFEGAA
jgi:uncharacterized protein YjbI with pentapeptide repeats